MVGDILRIEVKGDKKKMKVLKNIHKYKNYTYEDFDKNKHDIKTVSSLLYETEKTLINMCSPYNDKRKCLNCFHTDLFFTDDFENLKVIVNNNNIIGIVEYYTDLPPFNLKDLWKSNIKDLFGYLCMCRIKEDEFYISKLAVNGKYRRMGYGTKILEDLEHYAKKLNFKSMILDVECSNQKAYDFYNSFGFTQYDLRYINLEYKDYGLCHLKYDLVRE